MTNVSANNLGGSEVNKEPDPDDSSFNLSEEPDHVKTISKAVINVETPICAEKGPSSEPDPDDHLTDVLKHEPDPDDSLHGNFFCSVSSGFTCNGTIIELKPHNFEGAETLRTGTSNETLAARNLSEEPDPDDSETSVRNIDETLSARNISSEPDPDDSETPARNIQVDENKVQEQPADDEFHAEVNVLAEPDPDDVVIPPPELSKL